MTGIWRPRFWAPTCHYPTLRFNKQFLFYNFFVCKMRKVRGNSGAKPRLGPGIRWGEVKCRGCVHGDGSPMNFLDMAYLGETLWKLMGLPADLDVTILQASFEGPLPITVMEHIIRSSIPYLLVHLWDITQLQYIFLIIILPNIYSLRVQLIEVSLIFSRVTWLFSVLIVGKEEMPKIFY